MSSVKEHIAIPKDVNYDNDLDFTYLRDLGQQYIEDLSRKIFTDYNIHDPGITMMELVSYAITDIGLRIDQPIENIVASKEHNFVKMHEQFKSAKNILTSKPVTVIDYRKIFTDIKGVKNCWLAKYKLPLYVECNEEEPKIEFEPFEGTEYNTTEAKIEGLYTVLVDFEEGEEYDKTQIKETIFTKYHNNRNLCEDLVEVKEVPKQYIQVCAEIQLENEADEEYIEAQIEWVITKYLSPTIHVFTLKEMLGKELTTDQIFEGPILENGFITNDELEKSELRKEVRLSDIIKLIMQIEGVKLIEDISIDNCIGEDETATITPASDPWIICVENNHLPVLCNKSTLKYKKGYIPVGIEKARVTEFLKQFEQEETDSQTKTYDDLPMPLGKYAETKYETMQHDLPENYGISTYGLPGNATKERKVQAKQLQAYLLFFDQIISTYFSQLEHVKTLLSQDETLQRTYFFKAVEGIDGIETLVNNYTDYKNNVENIIDNLEDFKNRRNELLNHLISRFAEVFEDYTSAMYKLFGKSKESVENNIIQTKNKFLKEYEVISSERGLAFNYREKDEIWDTTNVSGFQKRIALLSGITNYNRRDLFDDKISIETLERTDIDSNIYYEYRWKIASETTTYLSSKKDYTNKQTALNNLLYALKMATDKVKYALHQTGTGKYYVVLKNEENEVIGRQYNHYYSIQENAETRLKETKKFINSIIFDEGFYLIENILTLPYRKKEIGVLNKCLPLCVEDNCKTCGEIDPFSYKVTIVFPGYTPRFSNMDFRVYMENLIRRELPAHILPRICWVGHVDGYLSEIIEVEEESKTNKITDNKKNYDLYKVQETWHKFLKSKNQKSNKYMASIQSTKNLLCAINELNTIYPSGTLHDCENEETELKNKIVLNRSTLGSQ